MKFLNELNLWLENATKDKDLINELETVKDNENEIIDRFYKDLEFGTGGLRGVIGAGTNRMNIYTVGKAVQGIADYVNSQSKNASVAIAYDSRIKSDVFAKDAATIFAANGLKVYIYDELMPTPMLSFAVRQLKCEAGINITASHNPAKYNGLKAYGPDGCQLTLEASEAVIDIVNKIDIFNGVKRENFDDLLSAGKIEYISRDVVDAYLNEVEKCSINPDVVKSSDFSVVYTPLHGAGNKPVREILKRIGVKNVTVVKTQESPNGNFPTAPYPNPEIRQAFEEALKVAADVNPDILLATDPDSDRVGIAVNDDGEFKLMSGNEVGIMLLEYVLSQRKAKGTLPANPFAIKTIVTSQMAEKVAKEYGCEIVSLLTGFKFIGEKIAELEAAGQGDRFVFGYEESYGYLAGSYVRDKDGVVAAMLICEMAAFYKTRGKTLIGFMNELYEKYGFYANEQMNFTFEGFTGMEKMAQIMSDFRANPPKEISGSKVVLVSDYQTSVVTDVVAGTTSTLTLPKSNVLAFLLADGNEVIVRPSGTEPKIKVYVTVIGTSREDAQKTYKILENEINKLIK